jgi:homoserine O-acetyltransferase
MASHIFTYDQPFQLQSGKVLSRYHLAYTTHGELNNDGDNVIWVFHALTANSDPAEWWSGLVGAGKCFDPAHHFIVCVNMPGSAYGSISPIDQNPVGSEPFYHDFPWFTTRDMVRAYEPLRHFLGIKKIRVGIGGSMGGQQLLEWAIETPDLFDAIIPIATNAYHSPWGIAFNSSQRMAIEADESWKEKNKEAGREGLKVARSIALLSYRHYEAYRIRQSEISAENLGPYKSESYQRYQGEKLAKRFNAFSYYFLTKGMDAHNLGRGRGELAEVLQSIQAKTLVIGIVSDLLFPISEQRFLSSKIPCAEIAEIDSLYGHDGFLLEYEKLTTVILQFLSKNNLVTNKI